MREIDITELFAADDAYCYSASRAELGDDAGRITWQNACEHASAAPLLVNPKDIEAARDWFGEFGAWDADERAAWSTDEVNALLLQYIAGDWRELIALCPDDNGGIDWREAEKLSEAGIIGGRIFLCDIPDHASHGHIFFTLA